MRRFFQGRAGADIERQLRANRPAPRPEVLGAISSRIVGTRAATPRRSAARYWIAIAVILAFVGVLASLGALSSAQKSAAGTATSAASVVDQIVSKPTSESTDNSSGGTTAPANTPSSLMAAEVAGQAPATVGGRTVTPSVIGNTSTRKSSPGLPATAGLKLPTVRFLATIGNYSPGQWICHFKGGSKNAPGQWDIIQLTSLAVYTEHASHPDDTGPYATEPPDKKFCVDNA